MIPGDLTDWVCSLTKLLFCIFKVFFPFYPKYSAKKLDFGYRIRQTLNSGPILGIPEALNQLPTSLILASQYSKAWDGIYYFNHSVNSDSYFSFSHGKSHISGSSSPFNVRIFNENYLRNPHKSNFSSIQNVRKAKNPNRSAPGPQRHSSQVGVLGIPECVSNGVCDSCAFSWPLFLLLV